ncbi:MAG: hypothetical protein U0230_20665 [Polyangiales bacterium]
MVDEQSLRRAESIVAKYTLIAAATGAFPVPAASSAIVAETAAMFGHLSSVLGAPVTWTSVFESLGFAAALNLLGRQVFVEVAKLLGWGAGGPLAAGAVSGVGATTAGIQTYVLGLLAIEIGKNDGRAITGEASRRLVEYGRAHYEAFLERARLQGIER